MSTEIWPHMAEFLHKIFNWADAAPEGKFDLYVNKIPVYCDTELQGFILTGEGETRYVEIDSEQRALIEAALEGVK
jgi:hypothetical protein